MDSLYHQTNKMILDIQNGLSRIERASAENAKLVETEIQARIDAVISNCERLHILVNKEPPSRRANAKLRVDQLNYDVQHLQAAMRTLQHKRYRWEEAQREREALLSSNFTANDSETSVMIDAALQHNQKLENAHRGMDDAIGTGTLILSSLRDQRGALKSAQKKMLDLLNTLGLSNTVMRLIERRTKEDRFILYGGMAFTVIVVFIIWKYYA